MLGGNPDGELGNQTQVSSSFPQIAMPAAKGVQKIAAGAFHTCAIANDGTYCWGWNDSKQVGQDAPGSLTQPTLVTALQGKTVTGIAAGRFHTCAIVNDGVECWGDNGSSQLGDPLDASPRAAPYSVIAAGSNVTGIAAGSYHTCAIVNGGVQCWGNNGFGQLGIGNYSSGASPVQTIGLPPLYGVTSLTAGGNHTCAIAYDVAQCWGRNDDAELGTNTLDEWWTPINPSGLDYSGHATVSAMSAGDSATCAVVDNAAKCWGSNSYGGLGVTVLDYRSTPIQVVASDVLFANRFEIKP